MADKVDDKEEHKRLTSIVKSVHAGLRKKFRASKLLWCLSWNLLSFTCTTTTTSYGQCHSCMLSVQKTTSVRLLKC